MPAPSRSGPDAPRRHRPMVPGDWTAARSGSPPGCACTDPCPEQACSRPPTGTCRPVVSRRAGRHTCRALRAPARRGARPSSPRRPRPGPSRPPAVGDDAAPSPHRSAAPCGTTPARPGRTRGAQTPDSQASPTANWPSSRPVSDARRAGSTSASHPRTACTRRPDASAAGWVSRVSKVPSPEKPRNGSGLRTRLNLPPGTSKQPGRRAVGVCVDGEPCGVPKDSVAAAEP